MNEPRKPLEIACRACGKIALARPESIYDGFRKVGEAFVCTACGERYASRGETPFACAGRAPGIFTAEDRPEVPRVFQDSERRRCCGWCAHRVVNPFGQRCGKLNREVESTDLCAQFELRAESEEGPSQPLRKPDPLAKLFGG